MRHVNTKSLWMRPLTIIFTTGLVFNNLWNHSIIFGDSYRLFAPHKYLIAQAIKNWTIYAWYPWQKMGMPFVGDILAGWFYPLNLIYLIFPFGFAHRIFIFVHYPLAAIFMDLFLRRRGLDRDSSLLGGLSFALSGYMVSQQKNAAFLIGPAWAPLAVYFMDRALGGSVSWAFGVAAVLTIQVFAGEPQSAAITAFIVALMAIIVALNPSRRRAALGSLITAGVFPVTLGAAQWLPTYELMRWSTRSGGIPFNESTLFSFHPYQMIELVWPAPFGRLWPDYFYWARFVLDNAMGIVPWSISDYIGLPVFVLAIAGIIFSRRGWRIWVASGTIFFLLLAFGDHTPLYGLLYRVSPLFRVFRFPAKYMAWFTGFTAVAAALGFERIQAWIEEKPNVLVRAAIIYIAVIAIGVAGAAFIWPAVITRVAGLGSADAMFQTIKTYLKYTGLQFLATNVLAGAILFIVSKKILSPRIGARIFILILISDYYFANVATAPVGPPDIYNFRPIVSKYINPNYGASLGRYRIYRNRYDFHDTVPGLAQFTLLERIAVWQRESLIPNMQAMEGFEEAFGYTSIDFPEDKRVFDKTRLPRMLELYNVVYILSTYYEYEPVSSAGTETIVSDQVNDLVINRLVKAMPRAYWAPSAQVAADEDKALAMLDAADIKKYVILTTNDDEVVSDNAAGEMKYLNITAYEPDRVIVESGADSPGWIVLSDRYYPGWVAFVDGDPVKIYRANMLVRAIKLGAGEHRVEFVYRPVSLRTGTAISMMSWVMLGAFLIVRYRKGLLKKTH